MKSAIYAGSFDPFTNGHLDIVRKASEIFDHVIILVACNPKKPNALFTLEERMNVIMKSLVDVKLNEQGVSVRSMSGGLIVQTAKTLGVNHLVRGLRPLGDFEPEYNMAMINGDLAQDKDFKLETVFLLADPKTAHMSSSLVREVWSNGGDITRFVPKPVLKKLESRLVNKETWR